MSPKSARPPEDYGQVRIPAELLLRIDSYIQQSQEGFMSRTQFGAEAIRFFLELKEAQLARRQAWDAWVKGGKKGLPPPAPVPAHEIAESDAEARKRKA